MPKASEGAVCMQRMRKEKPQQLSLQIDLPRAVKFKPRKSKKSDFVPKQTREGRTFKDFLAFRDDNPDIPLTQLDTVIGRIGGKAILTIHFVQSDFMAGLLLENKTAAEAAGKIQLLKTRLRESGFGFGTLLRFF